MTSSGTLMSYRGRGVRWLLVLLLGAAVADVAEAAETGKSCGQPKEVTGRPRIGLALAGGGGKGWAHVGVLKVLEELHVPIDCIAGTSAGSIIGGVHASGMSPQEIEEVVSKSDWGVMFQDSAPRKDQGFEQKRLDLLGLWSIELGVGKGGVKLPTGLFAGQEVNALLRRMTTRAVGVKTFDQLQIPFRAVATDLKTGDLIILDHGELASAMRASMAVPGAFTPEVIDGRILVDGGLRQNLPVQTVRAMGADIIIAVDLGTTNVTDAQLANPLAVAQQMVNILLDLNVYASREALKPDDVVIKPQVEKFSSGDFARSSELIPIGVKAARDVQERLLVLSLPPKEYTAFRDAQRARSTTGAKVARVEVDSSKLTHVNPAYVEKKFEVDERKGQLDESRVQNEIGGLLGEGDYERIDYAYADEEGGERVLLITPREKSWGPGYLRLGLQLATDFKEDTLQPAGQLPAHLAQQPGGRMAQRFLAGPHYRAAHRVLPAGDAGQRLVRRTQSGRRSNQPQPVRRRPAGGELPDSILRRRPGRGLDLRALRRAAAGHRAGTDALRSQHRSPAVPGGKLLCGRPYRQLHLRPTG